jgi:hypothetical protein
VAQDSQVFLLMVALLERILVLYTLAVAVVVLIETAVVRVQVVEGLEQVAVVEQELLDLPLVLVLVVAEKLEFVI